MRNKILSLSEWSLIGSKFKEILELIEWVLINVPDEYQKKEFTVLSKAFQKYRSVLEDRMLSQYKDAQDHEVLHIFYGQ
ncbi:MAG: hypothetical protein NTY12_02745 [Candidatus Falkowbacteria bacterium]|nr:hypothetical protein [Candidatus Falkowbacteria bacterium]